MNLEDLSTQLLYTTVPIWTEGQSGVKSSATAFIYNLTTDEKGSNSVPLLVTNHHVVSGSSRILIELIERDGDKPSRDKRVRVELDSNSFVVNAELDVALHPLGPALNELEASGRPAFFRAISAELIPDEASLVELAAMESVVFIGYPSGLRDDVNALPLIRQGITSTPAWSDFQGKPNFLIDAGVFPGSSGSPVFILNQGAYATKSGLSIGNRLLFLGVICQSMVRSKAGSETYLGLGKVLRSSAIREFIKSTVIPMIPPV
jgi:hypothetical protein